MDAEIAGLENRFREAVIFYNRASETAAKNEFIRDEALIHERTARYYLAENLDINAEVYLQKAHYLYYFWKAVNKVELLERNHPLIQFQHVLFKGPTKYRYGKQLLEFEHELDLNARYAKTETTAHGSLDLQSILKVSQAFSNERELPELLKKILTKYNQQCSFL